MSYECPVCGYPALHEPPRSEATGGSYEICPSCGFEFGVSDDDLGLSDEQWRQDWIKSGMPWRSIGMDQPLDWDPAQQLSSIVKATTKDPAPPAV